jgi:hypothetical protein
LWGFRPFDRRPPYPHGAPSRCFPEVGVTARHRPSALAAIVVAITLVFTASSAAEQRHAGAQRACTHGVSSIGPVSLRNGTVVGPTPAPHTDACLP